MLYNPYMPNLESMPPIVIDDQSSEGLSNQNPHKHIIDSGAGWREAGVAQRQADLENQVTSILDELDMHGIDGTGSNEENEADLNKGSVVDIVEQEVKREIDFANEFNDTLVEVYYPNTSPSIIADEELLSGVAKAVMERRMSGLVKWNGTKPEYDSLQIKGAHPGLEFMIMGKDLGQSDLDSSTVAHISFENRRGGTMEVTLTSNGQTINAVYDPVLGMWKEYKLTVFYNDIPDELGGDDNDISGGYTALQDADKMSLEDLEARLEASEVLPTLTIGQLYNPKTNTWSTRLVLNSGGLARDEVFTKDVAIALGAKAQKEFPNWASNMKEIFKDK